MEHNKEDWKIVMEQDIAESKAKIATLLEEELLDDDGYPTDAALEIIQLWHWSDVKGWFEFIQNIWHLRSWGWSEGEEDHEWDKGEKVYRYNISTAGWSGNESIIHAMQENGMLWHITWGSESSWWALYL
jgi:hypothetical protein